MRLDKFLKVSRLIRRRTLAKDFCDGGHVRVNQRPAKPGAEVQVGDYLELVFGNRRMRLEILALAENMPANRAKELYRVVEETFSLSPTLSGPVD